MPNLRRISQDHPRIRGEHLLRWIWPSVKYGSSPHTRGARAPLRRDHHPPGIIPAYAGSTRTDSSPSHSLTDHPRIRGEHGTPRSKFPGGFGSSPHTRGAPSRRSMVKSAARIIPAYAGSTSCSSGLSRRLSDHPRIRGEHGSTARMRGFRVGSSPHTRGARRQKKIEARHVRIIPAYAGSTEMKQWPARA